MKLFPVLFSVLMIFLVGCDNGEKTKNTHDSNAKTDVQQNESPVTDTSFALKVYVDNSGNITADGQGVSLNDLEVRLQTLKRKGGIVYYSRDNSDANPPEQSMQVMELVTKYELPIKFYTDKTFTQAVKIE